MKRTPMKRTAFARKPGTEMKRSSFSAPAKPMTRTAMKVSTKSVPAFETAHYRRVATLPCANCSIEGFSQVAHSNRHQDGKGLGVKANYLATFPLCCTRPGEVGCHVRHDQCIGMTREEADTRTLAYIADTQRKLGVGQ